MKLSAPAAPGVGQDPALDTTNLPVDHAPKFLAEAKHIYHDRRPPFVTNIGNSTDGSKRPVFVTKNGQRPLLPIRANLIARFWGSRTQDGIYWTLDLNGERFIVASFQNSGCLVGAKWVYCRWTGEGEEFEDRPLAFTCIHGEYTNTLISRRDTTAETSQSTSKVTTSIQATAHSRRQDHLPKITLLPKHHPVEFLDEAKELYVDSNPPFVIQKTKKPRRRVLLATQDGQFSASSTEKVVVYRAWDSANDYPTLDLDGKRFIVMGNAGGSPGGYQYHLWLGAKAGRVKKVVAYSSPSDLHAGADETTSGLTEHQPEVNKDPSLSSSSDDEEDQNSYNGETEDERYLYDEFRKGFDPTTVPLSRPKRFSLSQSRLSSERLAREEYPHRKPKPTKRARSHTPPPLFGSKKGRARGHAPKRTSRRARSADNSSGLSSPPYETPAPTPSINHPAPIPAVRDPESQTAATSLPTLTLYKQTHTTLRATRDSNLIGFVPLRLLTCMSMSTLFSSVITASGHREDEGPITCLMAVFDWKDENDIYKTIFIDKATQGSFEIFLEIIDEAPCWKDEGGKCGVAIEVVRA